MLRVAEAVDRRVVVGDGAFSSLRTTRAVANTLGVAASEAASLFMHHILVTAKGLSGGIYPITATVYRDPLDRFLHDNPFIHISTFGGSEVGCYVALEVLNILQEPGFLEHVRQMAERFQDGLGRLQAHHPALVEVRQRGLMMGLKLADPAYGPLMTLAGFHFGLLTLYANHDQSVNQLLPPLTIQEHEVVQVIESLDNMLTWLENR
jgi:acetylornithine/succinyldiaminopimelate/putrescine aminotransferase